MFASWFNEIIFIAENVVRRFVSKLEKEISARVETFPADMMKTLS